MPASIIVKPRCRIFHGHDWVYASDILISRGSPEHGDVISLKDNRGRFLGSAIFNGHSQIAARRFSFCKQDLDLKFFQKRIERALEYRQTLQIDLDVARIVWSESDGLPGVVIDRYGDSIVLQTLTLAMDMRKPLLVEAIKSVLAPRNIIERNDTLARVPEGMKQEKSVLHGTAPAPFEVRAGKLRLLADLMEGQKTGLYLDQLGNYEKVAALAKGRRVLDCFTNQGGFAQACALAGAREVIAVDTSEPALELARKNAASAGARVNFVAANAFDFLSQSEKSDEIYDLVILDPPSFTRTKSSIADALRGFKEICLRAIGMLEPGGLLVVFSCSHHITGGDLRNVIVSAAVDAKRSLRRRGIFTQRDDHPVIAGIPETEYLRGFVMEVMGAW